MVLLRFRLPALSLKAYSIICINRLVHLSCWILYRRVNELLVTTAQIYSPNCVNPCRALILTFATILSHTFHEAASTRLNYGANVL